MSNPYLKLRSDMLISEAQQCIDDLQPGIPWHAISSGNQYVKLPDGNIGEVSIRVSLLADEWVRKDAPSILQTIPGVIDVVEFIDGPIDLVVTVDSTWDKDKQEAVLMISKYLDLTASIKVFNNQSMVAEKTIEIEAIPD